MSSSKRALAGAAGVVIAAALLAGCNSAESANSSSTSTAPSAAQTPTEASSVTPMPLPTGPVASSAPATDAAPATPVTSTDKAITLTLPATWEDNTKAVAPAAVLSAKAKEPLGGFHPVIVVTGGTNPASGLPALIKATGEKKAKDVGGQFAAAPARTIGGVKADGYQITATQDGQKLLHREYFVPKAGKLYIVTLTTAADQKAAADAEFDKVLAGWAWA